MREPIAIAAWLLQLLHGEERHESLAENHLSRDDAQDNKPAHIRPGLVSSPSVPPSGSIIAPDTGLPHHPGLSRAQLARIRAQQAAEADGKETTLKDEHEAHKWHGYVAKPADGGKAWHDAYAHAAELVSQMTLEEKVNLTSAVWGPCPSNSGGVPRLNISGMCFDDGPAGPRYTDFVTQFPSAFTAAASFDHELISERARRIGREFRGKGINVALAPVTGGPLGRSPFTGRNWEAFSPDPYLSSTLSYLTVRGMQEYGPITCAKHYVLYEQEPVCVGPIDYGSRTECYDVSSEVDDKTLKELYLPSFVESVRAGTGAVMCSYNLINGTQSCENDQTMNRILKDELGFQGFILSDYGATHSTTPSVLAGMDMELPSEYWYGKRLLRALHKKQIPVSRLDDMARRILTPQIASGQTKEYPRTNFYNRDLADEKHEGGRVLRNEHVDVRGDNPDFARKVAAESTVLLKNTGVLPLQGVRRIGIFGSDADYPSTLSGCGPDLFCMIASERRYWNGTVTIGGGSGAAYADYIIPPLEGIARKAREKRIRLDWVLHDDEAHHDQMYYIARQSEVCMVFVSVYLVENWDRDGGKNALRLDKDGEAMIKRVESACSGQVVVVMHIGGQVIVEDWVDLPKIGAVLFAGYPGQESGHAIADILFGDVNPSGKLPFTMGKQVEDWPKNSLIRDLPKSKHGSDDSQTTEQASTRPVPKSVFHEGLAIDYKWFDKQKIAPRWEFGYGLSYTSFEMSDLEVKKVDIKDTAAVQVTNERYEGPAGLYDIVYEVTVNITNTGVVAGAEVAQLYLSYPKSETDQPPKHLRGFAKAYLEPGESRVVAMQLRKKDMAVWDVVKQLWRVPTGSFELRVGHSSRALPLGHCLAVHKSL